MQKFPFRTPRDQRFCVAATSIVARPFQDILRKEQAVGEVSLVWATLSDGLIPR